MTVCDMSYMAVTGILIRLVGICIHRASRSITHKNNLETKKKLLSSVFLYFCHISSFCNMMFSHRITIVNIMHIYHRYVT